MTQDILTVTRADTTPSVPVLAAAGELDHDSCDLLRDAADAALPDRGNRLVIDLGAVSFCDSGGLSLLLDLHRLTTARGGSLQLARVQPPVLSVIHATSLDRLLNLCPTVEDAVRASLATDTALLAPTNGKLTPSHRHQGHRAERGVPEGVPLRRLEAIVRGVEQRR
jgi:anti-sigma B factor antagonist